MAPGGVTEDECQGMIQRSLRTPMVRFLKEHLEKSGCRIGSNFIKATHCEQAIAGGYVRRKGIFVCSNHVQLRDQVTRAVIHGLIHAYDDCRAANRDWSDCSHAACTQIRASHLSGDCHYKREVPREHMMKVRGHEQDCVKQMVLEAMDGNPRCSKEASKDAMEAVWDICYNDTQPFDRAP